MADLLTEFLRELAARKFQFGECDCALALADWVETQTGADPAPHLRGAYRSKLGWLRIVRRAGGLVELVGDLALKAGLTMTREPAIGAIGVVNTEGGSGPVGAIRVSRGWAIKVNDGLAVGPAPHLAAWQF